MRGINGRARRTRRAQRCNMRRDGGGEAADIGINAEDFRAKTHLDGGTRCAETMDGVSYIGHTQGDATSCSIRWICG